MAVGLERRDSVYWAGRTTLVRRPEDGDTYDRGVTTITIETTLFSLEPFKLLWGGQSESVNPAKVDAFIPQFARNVAAELRREGLVK